MSFIGKIFNSLSYNVNKNIEESLYQNEVFLKSKWNFIEKSIVHWSKNYLQYLLYITIFFILLSVNLFIWKKEIKPLVFKYFSFSNFELLTAWQSGFLSSQLTIIAVVYPLVVGLIGVLLQNKSATKTIMPIYQKYSGFMFAGLSGLVLSLFILVGYFLQSSIDRSIYLSICISSTIWLAFNIFLTGWFFEKTFLMLDATARGRLVVRYSIHELCETDIRDRIHELLTINAIENGILINPDDKILDVLTYKYTDDSYNEYILSVPKDKVLKDIKYGLLNLAIKLQIWILKIFKKDRGILVVQPQRSSQNSSNFILVRYHNFEINPFVSFLLKNSFSFGKPRQVKNIGLTSMLDGLVGSANDALREENVKAFKEAIIDIVEWHTEIAMALSFKNDNGDQDNWLLLPISNFFSRSYLDELLREYYQLAWQTVEKIPKNSAFFNEIIYLHRRIYSSQNIIVNKEINSLIQGSYLTWYLLIEWRSYTSNSPDLRVAGKYEEILYNFVGAWESWLKFLEPRSERVGDIDKSYHAFLSHLEFTAHTIISALRFNNYEAAGWGVDMLNNWLDNFSLDHYRREEYVWYSEIHNHLQLKKDPSDASWKTILNGNEYNHLAAYNLAFKNASFDLRVLAACYILLKPNPDNKELLKEYVKALYTGAPIHETGSFGHVQNSISTAGDLLGVYIRHRDYKSYGSDSYGAWLSSILESFGRINEERRVSGRIYSGWGANDPRSMNKAYMEIAISLSKSNWSLTNRWFDIIFSNAFRHMDRDTLISDLEVWLQLADVIENPFLFDEDEKEILISNFKESIKSIIERLRNTNSQLIVDAEIDEDRLKAFGVACSQIFLQSNNTRFPISLFETIKQDAERSDEIAYSINIDNFAKAEVSKGVETNIDVNEYEGLNDSVFRYVKFNILRKLLFYPISDSNKYNSVEHALCDINELIKKIEEPILFVGNQALATTLHQSFYDKDGASLYGISRQDGFDREYICHIKQCEVYKLRFADVDFCLLTSRKLFDEISFAKITDEQYVEVGFIPGESGHIGTLSLKYWMNVKLAKEIPCIKLELNINEEDN